MITQEFLNGKTKIKIESAESIEDAKKHGFKNNQLVRYMVDGREVDDYSSVISEIIKNTQKDNAHFEPKESSYSKKINETINAQKDAMKDALTDFDAKKKVDVSFSSIKDKLDFLGMRVEQ